MKNAVTVVGFFGNNPEVRTAQSGGAITSLSLATTRSFKDGEGNRQTETEWHGITCFNGVGRCVAEHVTKGGMVMVTGRIHYTRWNDSEGQTHYGCEIIAEQVDFLAKAKEASKHPRSGARSCSVAPIEDLKELRSADRPGRVCACSFGDSQPIRGRDIETSGHPKVELPKWLFASVARNIRYSY